MVDLVITASSVVPGAGATKEEGNAGEAIAAGKAVYKASTGKWMLADSNSATAAARKARGIALNTAATDQPLEVQTAGEITLAASMTPGTAYFLSDTPGGIAPFADVGAGEFVNLLGVAKSANVFVVHPLYPDVSL